MQTLHNLDEYGLVNFEEAWQGNARRNLTGLPRGFSTGEIMGSGSSSRQIPNRGGWALPSTERSSSQSNLVPPHVRQNSTGPFPSNQSNLMPPHVRQNSTGPFPSIPGRRINIDGPGSTQFRPNGTGYSNQMNNRF